MEPPAETMHTGKLRVVAARVVREASIYAYRAVVRVTLDLGELERYPTTELGDFADRLL